MKSKKEKQEDGEVIPSTITLSSDDESREDFSNDNVMEIVTMAEVKRPRGRRRKSSRRGSSKGFKKKKDPTEVPKARTKADAIHKCDLCDKIYVRKGSLQVHIQRQHKQSSRTVFTCIHCQQIFDTLRGLTGHQIVHSEQRAKEREASLKKQQTTQRAPSRVEVTFEPSSEEEEAEEEAEDEAEEDTNIDDPPSPTPTVEIIRTNRPPPPVARVRVIPPVKPSMPVPPLAVSEVSPPPFQTVSNRIPDMTRNRSAQGSGNPMLFYGYMMQSHQQPMSSFPQLQNFPSGSYFPPPVMPGFPQQQYNVLQTASAGMFLHNNFFQMNKNSFPSSNPFSSIPSQMYSPPQVAQVPPAVCSFCSAQLPSEADLRSHIQSVHPENSWKCPICSDPMLSPEELSRHFATRHNAG